MAHMVFAPWAELDLEHGDRLMTVQEFGRLPEDGWLHELVEGRVVRVPPPKTRHGRIAGRLFGLLYTFVQQSELGELFAAETGFLLSRPDEPDTVLGADAAFVRTHRLPPVDSPDWDEYLRLAPDLIAEVASPDQYQPEMAAKAGVWLAAGVRLAWVMWPKRREVDVWLPGSDKPVGTLGIAGTLDGLDVLPGFTCSVAELFE